MILWVDGAHAPAENMRRDRELLAAAERGVEPVLRLFRFAPFGITLGLGQRPERELDLPRCEAEGIPWALRPTGGRAIFHAEEWTYSLAAPLSDPEWGGSAAESYARVSGWIAASLRRLGVPAQLGSRDGAMRDLPSASSPGRVVSPPCFASTARHEIVIEGRKLAGSAQRRTRFALLQQGSVLLGEGHVRLADYLALPEERRDVVRAELARLTCHAGRWLPSDAPLERWADALAAEVGCARRLDGASGLSLLTLSNGDSYTSMLARAVN